jgi:hypothetical protein
VEAIEEERGAREVARRPLSAAEGPEQLAGPGMDEAEGDTATGNSSAPAAPAAPPPALWLRTAQAQRDYWASRGRPERASRAMIEAYKNSFAEEEARFQHEIQPQQERLRRLNLTAEELKSDAAAVQLSQAAELNQMHAAGKLWGLMKMGATREALDLFNASNVLQPGVKAASIKMMKARGPGGEEADVMVLLDQEGKPLKNKKGDDMIYPVVLLERMHQQATTSTLNLKAGESIVQVTKDPAAGTTRVVPLHTAPNPTEQRQAANSGETLRQHGRQALKDRLFAGQTMMDKVDPAKQKIHGIAQPLVDRYVDQGMTPAAAVDKAVKEAEDQVKREAAGAGSRDRTPGGRSPTVRDIIGG